MRKNNITFNVRNITLNSKILTGYFTESKNIITLSLIILILSFVNIILNSFVSGSSNNSVSALSYASNVGIGFTFNPTLSVSLSSSDLTISNLAPGSSSDSNSINVNVATNASYGYKLSANVGSNDSSSPYYHSSDLILNADNSNSNMSNVFSSIATDADLVSLTTDNSWGYTTKLSNETNWNNYNGLSSSTNATLIDSSNTADSTGGIDFKIGAKASNTQASGIYTNTINFIAVSKVAPMSLLDSFIASGAKQLNGYFKMQDMTHDICESVDIEESELQLIDVRDNKIYWVAKLKDGNCWMTQNLDLDLSHEVALTSETSDIAPESYGTTIYTADTGYSKDEDTGIVSWLPSTIDSEGIQRADTIDMVWSSTTAATVPGWTNDYNQLYSADPGDRYLYTDDSGKRTIYTSFSSCLNGTNDNKTGCQHVHSGNYYNWSATSASNNTGLAPKGYIAANSICPKKWSLPAKGQYGAMMQSQEIWTGSGINYFVDGYLKIRTTPLYFTQSSYINSTAFDASGGNGLYWSRTVTDAGRALYLIFTSDSITPAGTSYFYARSLGFPVRCMVNID